MKNRIAKTEFESSLEEGIGDDRMTDFKNKLKAAYISSDKQINFHDASMNDNEELKYQRIILKRKAEIIQKKLDIEKLLKKIDIDNGCN